MSDVFAVAHQFVDLVRRQSPDDVALIVYYGSHALGTAGPRSDLDLYYIPDEGKGDGLYRSIIYQDCPFEFWPVSWDFAERIASGRHHWSVAPSIIANGRVLYARSPEDETRFVGLQEKIARLQQPESRASMLEQAQGAFESVAAPLYRITVAAATHDRAGAQWPIAQMIDGLLDCLALVNQTFFVKYWASNLAQVDRLALQPDRLRQRIEALLLEHDAETACQQAQALAKDTRAILLAEIRACPAPADPDAFTGYYPAIKEYVNKILSACERHDWVNASVVAAQMQQETAKMLAAAEDRLGCGSAHLLGEYRAASDRLGLPDLWSAIAARDIERLTSLTQQFDAIVQHYLTQRGIPLNSADTPEALCALIG